MTRRLLPLAAALLLLLSGCASFSPDGGFDKVAELTRERTGQAPAWQRSQADADGAEARVAELLQEPLTADGAVQIALLNNRGLQAGFAALGIAESDLVSAGRLANPSFGFGRLSGGGTTEIDRSLMVNVLALLTLPAATQLEQRRFEQAQMQAASDAVGVAAAARRAYYAAVAAEELLTYAGQVREAAEASAELARQMVRAGNFSRLDQLRQQSFLADAASQLARAQHRAVAERERLLRLLGLQGGAPALRLPPRLPDLPAQPAEAGNAEQTAMDRRLDILMARRGLEAAARQSGLTRATRFVNVLEAGYADKRQTGEPRQDGYEIRLELPIFDFGTVRTARAEAAYLQSLHRAAEVAVNARSEVRESWSAYRTAYDLARHYRDEVVPLSRRVSDETLLRYNGMLIGVFELLADARAQIGSVTASVEALRDHWIAETDLQTALTGGSPGSAASPRPAGTSATDGGSVAAH